MSLLMCQATRGSSAEANTIVYISTRKLTLLRIRNHVNVFNAWTPVVKRAEAIGEVCAVDAVES